MDAKTIEITDYRRFFGPYDNRANRWLVLGERRDTGKRDAYHFSDEATAQRTKAAWDALLKGTGLHTVEKAIGLYENYLRKHKQLRENSIKEAKRRLKGFFTDPELFLMNLTEARCRTYNQKIMDNDDFEPDTKINHVNAARTLCKWLVEERMIKVNPMLDIKRVGKRNKGKEQLRIDEALIWLAKAVEFAEKEATRPDAVAAMMSLIMGLRASEIVSRTIRDVDDDGRLLWIEKVLRAGFDVKTASSRRTLQIPELLQVFLRQLMVGKAPTDFLFPSGKNVGDRYKAVHANRNFVLHSVNAICAAAGVPVVTAHGMRGLHSTLSISAGATPNMVAAALGHASFATTAAHYAKAESLDRARANKAREKLGLK